MEENKLAQALSSVAKRMRADFEQSYAIRHRPSAGESREAIVHRFLQRQLPGHLEAICGGEIATAGGGVSPECDVIIADRSTPPLTHLEGYRVVPSECVYGVIEVKSKLDKQQLVDSCEKIAKVKALPKTAYYPYPSTVPPRCKRYGRTYPYMPTSGMIFAFDSIDLETLGDHFLDWCADRRPEECPDSIWILGKGYLVWTDPSNGLINATPEDGSGLCALEPWHDDDILLAFALQVNITFALAWMPPLRLTDYARQHPTGVIYRVWNRAAGPPTE